MKAQTCWEHVKARAGEMFSRRRCTAFSRRRRRRVAYNKEGPNEATAEFKDVGTPACTRERERGQTADRVLVKYLDRKARAPTANRRSRTGVGGARRGVREHGAVSYHKVALKEQTKTRQFSSKLKRAERETKTAPIVTLNQRKGRKKIDEQPSRSVIWLRGRNK